MVRGGVGVVLCVWGGGGAKNPRSVRVTAPSNLSYTDFFWKVLCENVFLGVLEKVLGKSVSGPGDARRARVSCRGPCQGDLQVGKA